MIAIMKRYRVVCNLFLTSFLLFPSCCNLNFEYFYVSYFTLCFFRFVIIAKASLEPQRKRQRTDNNSNTIKIKVAGKNKYIPLKSDKKLKKFPKVDAYAKRLGDKEDIEDEKINHHRKYMNKEGATGNILMVNNGHFILKEFVLMVCIISHLHYVNFFFVFYNLSMNDFCKIISI